MKIKELFENTQAVPKPAIIQNDLALDVTTHQPFAHASDYAAECATWLKTNCSAWIKQSKGELVYRGVQGTTPGVFVVKAVRKDRRPLHSDVTLHNLFNKAIDAAGLSANRTNSVFVTGNMNTARLYGEVHVAFPVGDFDFTWAPQYEDLFSARYAISGNADVSVSRVYGRYADSESQAAFVKEVTDALEGNDDSLEDAVMSGHEIMVRCDEVALLDMKFFQQYVKLGISL